MNNVVRLPKRRRPLPFGAIVAIVLAVGAGVGIGTHYAVETGAAKMMIDTMETAAVTATERIEASRESLDADNPVEVVQVSQKPLPAKSADRRPERISRGFSECHGAVRHTCVVDGDTFWIDGIKVRIADIDTPEVGQPKCSSQKALGDRATRRLIQLLSAGAFEMHALGDRDTDKYDRKLRVLVRNGRSIGDVLVSEGLARTWSGRREPWC